MTLEEHAAAISAAVHAAAADGFELDDTYNNAVSLDLNRIEDGDFIGECVRVSIPPVTYY